MFQSLSPDENKPPDLDKFRAMFGPGQVDQMVRHGLQFCWMMLPEGRKTPDDLEREFRSIVDRALRDYREDVNRFLGKAP